MTGWAALGLALTLTAALGGCAAIQRSEARSTEDLLSAAGFRQMPATTPERVNALETMKPRTITTVTKNGKTFWVAQDAAMDWGMWGPG